MQVKFPLSYSGGSKYCILDILEHLIHTSLASFCKVPTFLFSKLLDVINKISHPHISLTDRQLGLKYWVSGPFLWLPLVTRRPIDPEADNSSALHILHY